MAQRNEPACPVCLGSLLNGKPRCFAHALPGNLYNGIHEHHLKCIRNWLDVQPLGVQFVDNNGTQCFRTRPECTLCRSPIYSLYPVGSGHIYDVYVEQLEGTLRATTRQANFFIDKEGAVVEEIIINDDNTPRAEAVAIGPRNHVTPPSRLRLSSPNINYNFSTSSGRGQRGGDQSHPEGSRNRNTPRRRFGARMSTCHRY